MRIINIVLMLFFINLSAAIVNSINMYEHYQIQADQMAIDDVKNSVSGDSEYFQNSAANNENNNFSFGDFLKGFFMFIGTFALGMILCPYLMVQFGMDVSLAIMCSVPIYALYGLAIAQFISNRATKAMD